MKILKIILLLSNVILLIATIYFYSKNTKIENEAVFLKNSTEHSISYFFDIKDKNFIIYDQKKNSIGLVNKKDEILYVIQDINNKEFLGNSENKWEEVNYKGEIIKLVAPEKCRYFEINLNSNYNINNKYLKDRLNYWNDCVKNL